MSAEKLFDAMWNGYVDEEGNSLYDNNQKMAIDRTRFGERLIENASWLDAEEKEELQVVVLEAKKWWNLCEMPFALLKININVFGHQVASFTYGMGWVKPTHDDRWTMLLDVLNLIGPQVDSAGLCWISEMHVDQFESEMFLTIEAVKHY